MNGKFESYWEQENKVKLTINGGEEVWFKLASVVKPQYVKNLNGKEVSYSVAKDDDKMITYIRADNGSGGSNSSGSSYPKKTFQPTYNKEKQEEISKQWAINCALEQIKAHNVYCVASGKVEEMMAVVDSKIQALAQTKLHMRDKLFPCEEEIESS